MSTKAGNSNSPVRCLQLEQPSASPAPTASPLGPPYPSVAAIEAKLREAVLSDGRRFAAKYGRLSWMPARLSTPAGTQGLPLPRFYWCRCRSHDEFGTAAAKIGNAPAKRPLVQAKICDMFPIRKRPKLTVATASAGKPGSKSNVGSS